MSASYKRRWAKGVSTPFQLSTLCQYQHDDLELSYRHSRFRNNRLTYIDEHRQLVFPRRGLIEPGELVVTLALSLHRQDPAVLTALLEQNLQDRKQVDPKQRHLGSVFKDPPGNKARKLIEQAGLAGKRRDNAQISQHNANYIVNLEHRSSNQAAS